MIVIGQDETDTDIHSKYRKLITLQQLAQLTLLLPACQYHCGACLHVNIIVVPACMPISLWCLHVNIIVVPACQYHCGACMSISLWCLHVNIIVVPAY